MRVARDTGRPMRDVTKQSYALTLYTLWLLDRLDRERGERESYVRALERHDLARLVGYAYHEPKKLEPMRQELISTEQRRIDGKPSATSPSERDQAAKSAVDLLAKAAAVREWTPVAVPTE